MKLALPPLPPASLQASAGSSGPSTAVPSTATTQPADVSTQCATTPEPSSQVTIREWPPGTFMAPHNGGIVVVSCQMNEGKLQCSADICGGRGFGGSVKNEKKFDKFSDAATSVINEDLLENARAFEDASSHLTAPHHKNQGGAYWAAAKDITTLFDDRYNESQVEKPDDGIIFRCALPAWIQESLLDPDGRDQPIGSAVIPLRTLRQPHTGGKRSDYLCEIKAPRQESPSLEHTSDPISSRKVPDLETTGEVASTKSKKRGRVASDRKTVTTVPPTTAGPLVDLTAESPVSFRQTDCIRPFHATQWPPCTFKGPQRGVTVAISSDLRGGQVHFQSHLSGGCSYQGMGQEERFKKSAETFDKWVDNNHKIVWNATLLSASPFSDKKFTRERQGLYAARTLRNIFMEMSKSEATRLDGYHFVHVSADTIQSLVNKPPRPREELAILTDSTVPTLVPEIRAALLLQISDPDFQPPSLPWKVVWDHDESPRAHAEGLSGSSMARSEFRPATQLTTGSSQLPIRSGKRPVSPPATLSQETLGFDFGVSGSDSQAHKRQRSKGRSPAGEGGFEFSADASGQTPYQPVAHSAETDAFTLPFSQTGPILSNANHLRPPDYFIPHSSQAFASLYSPLESGKVPLAANQSYITNSHLDSQYLSPNTMGGGEYPHHPNRYSAHTSPNGSWHSGQSQALRKPWIASDVQGPVPEISLDTTNIDESTWRRELEGSQLEDLFPSEEAASEINTPQHPFPPPDHHPNTYQAFAPTQFPQNNQYIDSTSQMSFDPLTDPQLVLSTDFPEYDLALPEDFSFTDSPNQ
jgi:hypothetical protein